MEFVLEEKNQVLENHLKLKVSGHFQSTKEANMEFDKKFKKLKIFLAIFNPEILLIRQGTFDESSRPNLKNLELKPLELFLEEKYTEDEVWLDDALEDYSKHNIFDSFIKCINWLDGVVGNAATKYCSIRDVLAHLRTDRAIIFVKKDFPEIEFDGKTIKKNITNKQILEKFMPDILLAIQSIYKKHFLKESTIDELIVEIPCDLWCLHCEKIVTILISEESTSGLRKYNVKDFVCPFCGQHNLD
jgi:hypothetical protein